MESHNLWIEKAKNAIDAIFSDQSVSRTTTKESLEELIEHIQSMLDTLDE